MILEAVAGSLKALGAPYALVAGRAVAMGGRPRLTIDFDFLTADRRVFQPETWKALEDAGASVDIRKGDYDDPLAGVIHIKFDEERDADVVVAKWKWELGVIERSERMSLDGIEVPVPRTSDLILLKLAAGGYLDLQDVYNLLKGSDREQIIHEVEDRISALDADAKEEWQRILAAR